MAWIRADSAIATATPGGISGDWVKADSALATVDPGLIGGWVKADSQIVVVSPPGVPVCTPGETKCVGYDLYTCSLVSQWELTKHNATECGYVPEEEEEKPFPWMWVAIGGIATFIATAIALVKKKR